MSIRRKLLYGGSSVAPSVQQIPRSLMYGLLDAEISSSIAVTGSGVSSWTDRITGQSFVQATDGARPPYGATILNGRPGIAFDGNADNLRNTSTQAWPLSGAFEVWLYGSLQGDPAAASQTLFQWPSSPAGQGMRLIRDAGATRQASLSVGNGTAQIAVVASGVNTPDVPHVWRCYSTGSEIGLEVDGVSYGEADCVASFTAGTIRNTIGATAAATAGGFAALTIGLLMVTRPLPAEWVSVVRADLAARMRS